MRATLTLLIVFFYTLISVNAQSKSFKQTLDSIQKLRAYTFDEDLSLEERLEYALKSSELAHKTKVDTTILLSDRRVGLMYFLIEDHSKIFEWSHRNLKLAKKLNDSLVVGYLEAHLGWLYLTNELHTDSAYYYHVNSSKILQKLEKKQEEINVLINLIGLQYRVSDYIGIENSVERAFKLIKELPENENNLQSLWFLYNTVGLISVKELEYDKALEYYRKGLKISSKMIDNHEAFLFLKINTALAFEEQKKYTNAINIYIELLNHESLYDQDIITYAELLNNLAYARFLNQDSNHKEIKALFKQAYKIIDSVSYNIDIPYIGNELSEFYLSLGQKDSALPYLNRSLKLAKQANLNEEVLESLKLLAQATDGEAGKQYLYDYIALNDSLIAEERTARNKFARIRFETDEITEQRDKATKQRSLLFGASISLVAILLLLVLAFYQRSKNKQLRFDKAQQQANESIYSLMLKQQSTLEQGRTQERYRISEELHDGILSKLFGTRMGLGLLSKSISASDNDLKKYNTFIDSMQAIENDIRNVSHALKDESLTNAVDFVAIIEHYIKDTCDLHHLEYTLYANPEIDWTSVNDHIKVNLYRVLQESLQNVIKHAKANTIDVSFYLIDNQLQLSVKDNGIGFNTKQQHKGIGLKNIKSRIGKLSGSFSVTSNINKGAIINVSVPI